jgi:serine protease Do
MHTRHTIAWIVAAVGTAVLLPAAGVATVAAAPGSSGAQPAEAALYRCKTETTVAVALLGLDLCDAEPTPLLAERAEPDNLQTRDGALVVDVEEGGIAAVAGVQPGDMIYRVAGVDVPGAADAGAGLADVGTDSDTQINFLRRGRPYRIKLRR